MDITNLEKLKPKHITPIRTARVGGLTLLTIGFFGQLYTVDTLNNAMTRDRDIQACAKVLSEQPVELTAQQFPFVCDTFADDFRQENTWNSLEDTFPMPASGDLADNYINARPADDPLWLFQLAGGTVLMISGVAIAGNSYKPNSKQ